MLKNENVLVIGSGGREHALARSLAVSSHVKTVYCAPGNAGMARFATLVNVDTTKSADVLQFITQNNIKLTVIGPEIPLVAGLADDLRAKGHLVLGPGKKGAQLEGSKVFAKNFMAKHGIPTAKFRTFDNAESARAFARSPEGKTYKILKADGLAAGKGVFVTNTTEELLDAISEVMEKKKFGASGNVIILEEKLDGPEISVICLTDGKTVLPLPPSQDHKRALDGDKGPNTGGMGAYAPTPFYDEHTQITVEKTITQNFLRGLKAEGIDFRGVIYFGLMLTKEGPKVLEFNTRFGDPEAQTILPLIESDVYEAFLAVAEGRLSEIHLHLRQAFSCTIALVSGGYPGEYKSGYAISGLDDVERKGRVFVFHAGTKADGGRIVTNGGRVLNITGLGRTLKMAVVRAYQGAKKVSFQDMFFRSDIAGRALKNKMIQTRIKRMKKRHGKETVKR